LVSDIPAGDGKTANLFLQCSHSLLTVYNCCRDPKECVPPVRPKSAGYVFYAGCLAFIIPAIILSTLYVAIAVRQLILHKICTV
jgi:hypothetical protein